MTNDTPLNSYDEVPYSSYPYRQSHPDRLATIGTLFGMSPVPLQNCRVLELGCSSGGNLIPLAEQFPEARFVGIDASRHSIDLGQQTISDLGLANVELQHGDILEFPRQADSFDYIICHGVFSWVPDAVQSAILDICRSCLSEQGIAYISYNTNPGWRLRGTIRDVMAYHAQFFDGPDRQLTEARGLVDFLARAVPTEGNPYGMLLQRELAGLRDKEQYYLYHEYLEDVNAPLYFHEFASLAGKHDLQYLGEADYSTMSARNFPGEAESMLKEVSDDTIRMEQYMDFVRNRTFRQTLLCHSSATLNREIAPESAFNLLAASSARPEDDGPPSIDSRQSVRFVRGPSSLTSAEPLVKSAMLHLRAMWPQPVPFDDLLSAARRRLAPGPMILDADRLEAEKRVLAGPLIRCFATNHVDLHFAPHCFTLNLRDRPVASRLARYQARSAKRVTSLRHDVVPLTDLQRFLLQRLDGNHDRNQLLEALQNEISGGSLIVLDDGTEVRSPDRSRVILQNLLEKNLTELARKALLAYPAP